MSACAADLSLVRRFWALYQARKWTEAQALLHPQATCQWWATAERFEGAAAIVHVNAVYPGDWTIHLLELNALSGESDGGQGRRVHSLVRVDQGERAFYANSFFSLELGRITAIDEYWADAQAAPDWRLNGVLPGCKPSGADGRQGQSLALDLP